jgi:hypothetical protein
LVPEEGCVLTGDLTYEDRSGTIIDWNLCFNANGTSSDRAFRSGTPAFMAPVLLSEEPIPRRTLGHDMESFFAVILWVATLDYHNEANFQEKPLAKMMLDKQKPMAIVNAKENWFKNSAGFLKWIVGHFEAPYLEDVPFLTYLDRLRDILYPDEKIDMGAYLSRRSRSLDKNDDKETGDTDPMKEGLFRQCMKEIDDYLNETKGCDQMQWVDSHSLAPHAPEGR